MTRILTAFLFLALASPAWATVRWSPTTAFAGGCSTFTFEGSDQGNAQPDIRVPQGELSFSAVATNGTAVDVKFYYVNTATDDPAAEVTAGRGTLAATVVGSGWFPAYTATNGGLLDVDIDTDGDGGTVKVCSAGYAKVGAGSAGTRTLVSAQDASYDVVANGTTGITRWADGTTASYTNSCLQLQEAINRYLDTAVSTYESYAVKYAGDFNIEWTDFYDQGPYRNCLAIFPSSSVPGTQGTGGFSTNDAARTGWPEIQTRVVATGMGARTATAGAATTLTDGDGSDLSGQGGKYVRITGGTGAGQTRYIASATATVLTVDLAWGTNPDATTIYDIVTIPFRSGGGTGYTIHWDNVRLLVTQTGQNDRGVVIQRGNGWACGETNNTSEIAACAFSNFNEHGQYAIVISGTDATSTGWVNGRLAEIDTTNLINADRAMIAEMNFDALRGQNSARVNMTGGTSRSQDNIGIWSAGTWGASRTGTTNINTFGNAITLWYNNYGSWDNFYVSDNHVGISYGTGTAGGEMQHLTTCTSGYCSNTVTGGSAHGATFMRALVESNDYGQVVSFDTSGESGFVDLHLENGTVLGHQIVMGAGQCSAADATTVGRPCAEDLNCVTGTCQTNGGTTQSNSFFFNGGSLGSHSPAAADPNWRQFALGENFTENAGKVIFSGGVELPNTSVPANSTGTLPCTGGAAPYFYCKGANSNDAVALTFSLPTVTTGIDAMVELGDARCQGSTCLIWPYNYVSSQKEFTLGEWVMDTDGIVNPGVGNAMPKGVNTATAFANPIVGPLAATSHLWGIPFHVVGNANGVNTYIKSIICVNGSYDDGAEATESSSWNVLLGNVQTDTDGVASQGNPATLTEGTTAAGVPVANDILINTAVFGCSDDSDGAGGNECNAWGTSGQGTLGIQLQAETDAGAQNALNVACKVRGFLSPATD